MMSMEVACVHAVVLMLHVYMCTMECPACLVVEFKAVNTILLCYAPVNYLVCFLRTMTVAVDKLCEFSSDKFCVSLSVFVCIYTSPLLPSFTVFPFQLDLMLLSVPSCTLELDCCSSCTTVLFYQPLYFLQLSM